MQITSWAFHLLSTPQPWFLRHSSRAVCPQSCGYGKVDVKTDDKAGSGLLGRDVVKAFETAGWKAVGTGNTRAQAPIIKLDLLVEGDIARVLDEVKYVGASDFNE